MIYKSLHLSELAEIGDGNHSSNYPKSSEMLKEGIPFLRSGNIQDGKITDDNLKFISPEKHQILKKGHIKTGDILFTNRGEIGKIGIVDERFNNANLNSQVAWIRVGNQLYNRFLYHYLSSPSVKNFFLKSKTGTALQQITIKQLKSLLINIPPFSEQQRIVAKLDAAFAEIDKKKEINFKKLNFIDNLKESILSSKIGKHQIKLSDACDLIKRGISPKYLESGGVAVINQKCIRNHKIDFSKTRRHNITLKKVPEERFIRKGDVLINSTGHGTLGRVAQVTQEIIEKTTVDSHVTIVRPKQKIFNLDFFGNALIKIEKKLEAAGEGTSGQTELSRSKLENDFFIPYVVSINEQKKISHILNNIFENIFILKNLLKKTIDNLEALKLSFLNKEIDNQRA